MNATGRTMLWALIDLLGTSLGVALMAVNPTHAHVDGVKPKAEFLISADWPLARNSDIDLWLIGPERKPVFYGFRQVGCADLDRDTLGYATSHIYLADGSYVQEDSGKETISLRCLNPGHYDVAVNYYSDHDNDRTPVPVHVDITALNPSVRTLYLADVALAKVGQTINVVSFDLDRAGNIKLVDPPLTPITQTFSAKTP